jgi:hypothetical protein
MTIIRHVFKELLGMFLTDVRLTLAILFLVGVASVVAALGGRPLSPAASFFSGVWRSSSRPSIAKHECGIGNSLWAGASRYALRDITPQRLICYSAPLLTLILQIWFA